MQSNIFKYVKGLYYKIKQNIFQNLWRFKLSPSPMIECYVLVIQMIYLKLEHSTEWKFYTKIHQISQSNLCRPRYQLLAHCFVPPQWLVRSNSSVVNFTNGFQTLIKENTTHTTMDWVEQTKSLKSNFST